LSSHFVCYFATNQTQARLILIPHLLLFIPGLMISLSCPGDSLPQQYLVFTLSCTLTIDKCCHHNELTSLRRGVGSEPTKWKNAEDHVLNVTFRCLLNSDISHCQTPLRLSIKVTAVELELSYTNVLPNSLRCVFDQLDSNSQTLCAEGGQDIQVLHHPLQVWNWGMWACQQFGGDLLCCLEVLQRHAAASQGTNEIGI
jgi:hypothetical protein